MTWADHTFDPKEKTAMSKGGKRSQIFYTYLFFFRDLTESLRVRPGASTNALPKLFTNIKFTALIPDTEEKRDAEVGGRSG
jgi:hypothetical protein